MHRSIFGIQRAFPRNVPVVSVQTPEDIIQPQLLSASEHSLQPINTGMRTQFRTKLRRRFFGKSRVCPRNVPIVDVTISRDIIQPNVQPVNIELISKFSPTVERSRIVAQTLQVVDVPTFEYVIQPQSPNVEPNEQSVDIEFESQSSSTKRRRPIGRSRLFSKSINNKTYRKRYFRDKKPIMCTKCAEKLSFRKAFMFFCFMGFLIQTIFLI